MTASVCRVPLSQRSSISPASLTTPRMASILKNTTGISRANSDPLPPRPAVTTSKGQQFSESTQHLPTLASNPMFGGQ